MIANRNSTLRAKSNFSQRCRRVPQFSSSNQAPQAPIHISPAQPISAAPPNEFCVLPIPPASASICEVSPRKFATASSARNSNRLSSSTNTHASFFPRKYRDWLRVRPPALLKVNMKNAYPRCYVTRRISADGGSYFGPFPNRKFAESFADEFLNLFKIRRCQIKIRRDPSYPGCIYSEMKMCLAPCFAGCSKDEYDAEVARVLVTLSTSGSALTDELGREREAASAALDFERAAALHKKIEKAETVLKGFPELARRLDELDAVILQKSAEENAIAVFVVRAGIICDPFLLRFAELSSQPRSVEEILRAQLEPPAATGLEIESTGHPQKQNAPPAVRKDSGILGEHLALLTRWFYSKPRQGEIFFRSRDWPYRRIIRACSRVLNPPAGAAAP